MAAENYRAPSVAQSAELAEQQGVGITADWVLGYLNTDAPEDSRDAIRNAFTEWSALAATGKQQVGESNQTTVDSGALRLALNVLRRAGKGEVAEALESTAARGQQVGEVQGDALSLAEHITDHLCHHEYAIGGRSELLACVTQALAAQAGQGAVPCATSASLALRVAYRHLDMVSMRVSHCKDAAIIESAMKDVDTFDLNAAISALAARQPGAQVPVEMSPDFTDSARGAIAWVLWHHQGGSSPIGQPLRHALGMGSDQRLSQSQIDEAKRFALWAGATTNDFHRNKTAHGIDLGQFRDLADFVLGWAAEDEGSEQMRESARALLALIDQRDAAPGVGNG